MSPVQLDFDAALAARDRGTQDAENWTHRAVTDLIAADPLHAQEREAVIAAMRRDSEMHDHVNPNCVRALVPSWVGPRVLSSMYGVLARKHVLQRVGTEPNRDTKGRNVGKHSTVYRWAS